MVVRLAEAEAEAEAEGRSRVLALKERGERERFVGLDLVFLVVCLYFVKSRYFYRTSIKSIARARKGSESR